MFHFEGKASGIAKESFKRFGTTMFIRVACIFVEIAIAADGTRRRRLDAPRCSRKCDLCQLAVTVTVTYSYTPYCYSILKYYLLTEISMKKYYHDS